MILPLLDRRPELVQLRQLPPILVGKEQVDRFEAVGETLGDSVAQLVEPFAGQRGDLDRVGKAVGEASAPQYVSRVDLVDDDLDRKVIGTDVVQNGGNRCRLLIEAVVRYRSVDDVQDEIRDECLLERGREPFDELGR